MQGEELLEREREVVRIEDFLDRVRRGSGGQLIVAGPAGIGKSSLLAAARERAADLDVMVARGGELERDYGFGVVRQLLEPRLRRAPEAERAELLGGAAALAGPVVAGSATTPAGPDAGFAVTHGLYWLVDNLARRGPALLVVDDAHWADLDSLRFLLFLARRLDGVAAGVLCGWRTDEPASPKELLEGLSAEPLVELMRPDPLSATATEKLVRRRVSEVAEERFCRACHDATGGNPFLLGELLNAVAAGHLSPTAEAADRVGELGPAAVARSLFLRLSRLGPEALAVAQAVSVLDVDADLLLVARLAGLPADRAAAAASELEAAGILGPGLAVQLAHPILRSAIYGELDRADRQRLHLEAARALDAAGARDRAAAHLLATEPGDDPWVTERLAAAGERALERGSAETAVGLLERALAEQPGRRSGRLLFRLGSAEQMAGRPAAAERFVAAMQEAEEPSIRWHAARWLARQYNARVRQRDAVAVLESVLAEQLEHDPPRALVTEAEMAAYGSIVDEMASEAGPRVERVAAAHSGDSEPERMVQVAAAFDRCLATRGTAAEVSDMLDRALVGDRLLGTLAESSTAFWACGALMWCGRLEEAARQSDAVLAEGRRRGGEIWVSAAATWRALTAWNRGDLRDAEAYAHAALDAAANRFPVAQFSMAGLIAQILRLRGELAAADAFLAAHGYADVVPPRFSLVLYLPKGRAAVRMAQGRYQEARRDAEFILQSETARGGIMPDMLPDVALALAAAGEEHRALAVARRSLEIAERWGVPGHLGAALRATGLLEGGSTGLERLRRSVEVLEDSPFRFERARSLVEYGAALRRDNQRQAAREPLAAGMEMADRCGSPVLVERAHDELRAAGARPRQIATSGADSLTPSERRTAQLAASGLSNRAVAQALFVTTKTVETHLRHAFQKLGVRSRDELAVALGGPDERPVVTTIVLVGGLLPQHTELVRQEVTRAGGRAIGSAGDGFRATFDSASAAVRCGQEIVSQRPALRTAVHCGEVNAGAGDIHGLAADVAARILGRARAGEVLCSGTIVDLTAGSDLRFDEHDAVELDRVPGRWRVFAAVG